MRRRINREALSVILLVCFLTITTFNTNVSVIFPEQVTDELVLVVDHSHFPVGKHVKPFSYSYVDPKEYKGAVVRGWEPHVSRRAADYVKPEQHNVVSNMSCFDWDSATILILVQSHPGGFEQRQANRDTWMKRLNDYPDVRVVHIFGTPPPKEMVDQAVLAEEQAKFCDTIQFDYVDTYKNITIDTLHCLKVALGWSWAREPDFLAIADDDTYIDIPEIYKYLSENVTWQTKEMLGDHHCSPTRKFVKTRFDEDKHKFFRMPTYILDDDYLPCGPVGGFYVLPRTTWQCIFATALATPIHPVNDIFMGYLAEACGVRRTSSNQMQLDPISFHRLVDQAMLAFHGVGPANKVLIEQILYVQDRDIFKPYPKGFYLNQTEDGKWNKYLCDDQLDCKLDNTLSVNGIVDEKYKISAFKHPECVCTNLMKKKVE